MKYYVLARSIIIVLETCFAENNKKGAAILAPHFGGALCVARSKVPFPPANPEMGKRWETVDP